MSRKKIIDLVPWCEANVILDDGKPIRFEKHQRKILGKAFKVGADGRLSYSTVVYSCPKKSGKTCVGAVVALWFAYELEPGAEVILAANDLEQSTGRAYREVRKMVERSPVLKSRVSSITAREITLTDGTSIKAIPTDAAGEAGANQSLSVFDELWGYTSERSRRLFEELTPVPTRATSVRLVTTYSGYEGESLLLEELYQRGMNGTRIWSLLPCWENGPLFMYWDNRGRMPWQTKAYYQAQRQELRLIAYLRLHENRWVSSESGLFDMQKWDAATDPRHSPPLPNKSISLYVGCDASTKRDRSAVVSVYRDESGKIKLGPKRFWQPSKAQPMDLEVTMEAYLLELSRGYNLTSVLFDPFQFHRSAMTLQKQGLPMVEFPQTSGNLTEMGQNLFDLVEYGNLVLYSCKDLRYEASVAVAKETPRGLRIAKEKSSQKIDQIVSLAMACLQATKAKTSTFRYFFFDPENHEGEEIANRNPL